MAKSRRWLVRFYGAGSGYGLYFGTPPKETQSHLWPANRFFQYLQPRTVKEMWDITLKPGGGPVELKG
jgi:hypothetical protein